MAKEIERKFLVNGCFEPSMADSRHHIVQAYLSVRPESTVRVRIIEDRGFLTVKGKNAGAARSEWEYEIPVADARQMIEECSAGPVINKMRYRIGRWEVDVFSGHLGGLAVAEIELASVKEDIVLPDFAGREVTGDPRYYNSVLSSATELPPLV